MTMVHEEMHHRTRQQQQVRQVSQSALEMRAMLHEEKVTGHQEKPEYGSVKCRI